MGLETLPADTIAFFQLIGGWLGAGAYIIIVATTTALLGVGAFLFIKKVIAPALVGLYHIVKSAATESSESMLQDQKIQ